MSIVEKFGLWTFVIGVLLILLWNVLAGGISHLPGLIALGGLLYWLVGLVLFRIFKLSAGNIWQGVACALPVTILVGWLIHFYTYDGVPKKYLIREGYRGRITIVYDHPRGITPATHGDTTIFVIPPDGMLLVDIPYEPTDYSSSPFYFMGIRDNNLRKIPMHYYHSRDSISVQAILGSTGSITTGNKAYKVSSNDIDIPNNGYWDREEEYDRKEYRRLFRVKYGDRAYRKQFENKPD